jgi:hypothetical protein
LKKANFSRKDLAKIFALLLTYFFSIAWSTLVCAEIFNIAEGDVIGLISAIDSANLNDVEDTINLAINGSYTLTVADPKGGPNGPTGLPSITSVITINGNGAAITRSSTAPKFRIFHLAEDGKLNLNELTIDNGFAPVSTGSRGSGGGIVIYGGELNLNNSIVSNNYATYRGGGIRIFSGALNLNSVAVSENDPDGIENEGGIVTITDSVINHNTCGISNRRRMSGMTITSSIVTNNSPHGSGVCGGIYNSGTLTLIDSNVSDNRSGHGGGIYNYKSELTIINSTINENRAASGGGIYNNGLVSLYNVTISGNESFCHFSHCPMNSGGGIINGGTAILSNVTIKDNMGATRGWGHSCVGTGGIDNGGSLELSNSIVADNSCGDCKGEITSLDYNIDSDDSCNFTQPHDQPNTDPLLGPLANNGGPTLTHALLPGSPAIDAADNTNCPETDQRGFSRPVDGDSDGEVICDIGSYEVQADELILPGDLNNDSVVDSADYSEFRKTLGKCDGDTGFNLEADYDEDGCVSYRDYRIWYGYYLDYSE